MKNILLMKLGLVSLGLVTLSGCTKSEPIVEGPYPITEVVAATAVLPVTVGATDDMPITAQALSKCATINSIEIVSQTANKLELKVYGYPQVKCPNASSPAANLTISEFKITSKTPVARVNPYEVWVNGAKVGMVEIK